MKSPYSLLLPLAAFSLCALPACETIPNEKPVTVAEAAKEEAEAKRRKASSAHQSRLRRSYIRRAAIRARHSKKN